jgi:carotenoid cleavage dioxygenase-like enzyme
LSSGVAAGATPRDYAPLLERLFFFDAVETSYEVSGIQGRIPEWLRGTYYVNGPARFEAVGQQLQALAGWRRHGLLAAVRTGGRALYQPLHRDTEAARRGSAGRFLFRGFGTSFPNDRLRRKVMLEPPVNVSVYPYNGKLLAFGEQTLPYELDPVTLETRGEYDFNGSLNEVSPFAAHAKYDGHLLNFGVAFSAAKPTLNVYEFDGAGGLVRRKRHEIQFPHSTPRFCLHCAVRGVLPQPAADEFPAVLGRGRVGDGVARLGSRTKAAAFWCRRARGRQAESFMIPVGAGYCLHLINCFEEAGRLTVDVLEIDRPVYPDYEPMPDIFIDAPPCRPVRYVIDLEK